MTGLVVDSCRWRPQLGRVGKHVLAYRKLPVEKVETAGWERKVES